MEEQGGKKANRTGNYLEMMIEDSLQRKGYLHIQKKKFYDIIENRNPIYTRQINLCDSIYGTKISSDFILYHPEKYPECLAIESKWQQAAGSVDEKYPFLVHNIKEQFPCSAIIVIDGDGYKKGAIKWLRSQVDDKLLHVFNIREYITWVNDGGLG